MPFTKIEVKHIYQNSSHYAGVNSYLPLIWDNRANLTYTSPNNVYQPTAFVKAWTLPVPTQGTDEDQRVGNKITPQSYHSDIIISPNYSDYLPNVFNKLFLGGGGIQSETNYLLTKSKYYIRLMIVDFYNDDYNTVMQQLNNWYRATYVPTGRADAVNVSCSQRMLRESTEYTGSALPVGTYVALYQLFNCCITVL